jgi:prepilin-type N-terminal cleavage/methylation domain-containing protein
VIVRRSSNDVELMPGVGVQRPQVSSGFARRAGHSSQLATDMSSARFEEMPPQEALQRRGGYIRREPGFTLIEVLIVIVVLGILAAVVIFALGGIGNKTAVAACQADGATVASAISVFNHENENTTVTIGDLTSGSAASLGGPYISSWPSNGTHYAFGISAGTLIVEAPWPTAFSATTPTATGTNLSSGIAYTGPSSCAGVQ